MYKIKYNPIVYNDLSEIYHFIALDNEDIAKKILNNIIDAIDNIVNFPNKGIRLDTKIRKKTIAGMRYIIIKNYYVFYTIDNDIIRVYRVLHSKRNYINILS